MRRSLVSAVLALLAMALTVPLTSAVPVGARLDGPVPGAPGAGDPYFPMAGNGGYDVQHYTLDLRYHPETDRLAGTATVEATAVQQLSRFNLDLSGLRVRSVQVNGQPARWDRRRHELRIRPSSPLPSGESFRVAVTYAGVPQAAQPTRSLPFPSGFFHTRDGSLVIGEPKVAASWFPVNDHPSDKASYTFRITAPRGRQVVANGELVDKRTVDGWTTWHWEAVEPMAPYLATANVGRWRFFERSHGGIEILDAVDRRLMRPLVEPPTGTGFAWTSLQNAGYQRLARSVTVPAHGARMSFALSRDTELDFDYFTVEAHTAGQDDWTTLRDLRGHTRRSTGYSCLGLLELHPFLRHYMTPRDGGERCDPRGTTGRWHAATGTSRRFERWAVDLSAYAGREVEVVLTLVGDGAWEQTGAFVDDIRVSTGEGTTSFEPDGDAADGWSPVAAPRSSPPQERGWTIGLVDQSPERAALALRSLGRQGEILDFLAGHFGPYPFTQAGGIVDDVELFLALENQTRPIYPLAAFSNTFLGDSIIVHELAHQWVGDSLTVRKWRHIWLNEGFATYAEWLWWEHIGVVTVQEVFDGTYRAFGPRDRFWEVRVADPGPRALLDFAVYERGAMTLHALRTTVGDDAFREILRRWTQEHEGGLVTTGQFVRLAEQVAGRQLDRLFHRWLWVTERPPRPEVHGASALRLSAGSPGRLDRLPSPTAIREGVHRVRD